MLSKPGAKSQRASACSARGRVQTQKASNTRSVQYTCPMNAMPTGWVACRTSKWKLHRRTTTGLSWKSSRLGKNKKNIAKVYMKQPCPRRHGVAEVPSHTSVWKFQRKRHACDGGWFPRVR
eukprot:TRINITY_DN64560_c0_g1_i1.p1 TRINITY_DN64560_c0_g1~~TRINITY_DN64560_c0_g1_i1.p1  ORF type:complete len:121 (-),score=9.23 TRINITY_DN64560_c0_g1_i1:367-729(-)